MIDFGLAKTLGLIGLTMEFVSFFLAAPELIGEQRLRNMEAWVERRLSWLLEKKLLRIASPPSLRESTIFFIIANGLNIMLAFFWIYLIRNRARFWVIGFVTLVIISSTSNQFLAVGMLLRLMLDWLSSGERLRRLLLTIGILMFVMSYFVQFAAVFITSG